MVTSRTAWLVLLLVLACAPAGGAGSTTKRGLGQAADASSPKLKDIEALSKANARLVDAEAALARAQRQAEAALKSAKLEAAKAKQSDANRQTALAKSVKVEAELRAEIKRLTTMGMSSADIMNLSETLEEAQTEVKNLRVEVVRLKKKVAAAEADADSARQDAVTASAPAQQARPEQACSARYEEEGDVFDQAREVWRETKAVTWAGYLAIRQGVRSTVEGSPLAAHADVLVPIASDAIAAMICCTAGSLALGTLFWCYCAGRGDDEDVRHRAGPGTVPPRGAKKMKGNRR